MIAPVPNTVHGTVTREFGGITWRPDPQQPDPMREFGDGRPEMWAALILMGVFCFAAIGFVQSVVWAVKIVAWLVS